MINIIVEKDSKPKCYYVFSSYSDAFDLIENFFKKYGTDYRLHIFVEDRFNINFEE